jgi:primosomal protein N' (replication factor Y)
VTLPVARVCVDVPTPHLDRPFDYSVPAEMADTAVVGARVRVRFHGRLVGGYVLERAADSEHEGPLLPLSATVSAEPVLLPEVAELARAVADRYAGTLADVVRLAVPPRHARVEREPAAEPSAPAADEGEPVAQLSAPAGDEPGTRSGDRLGGWQRYPNGPGFLAALAAGRPARAVWYALPGPSWADELAAAAQAALSGGRGVLIVVPDARDVTRVATALDTAVGPRRFVTLSADLGPAERYRRFLAVSRGRVRVVLGTRAAMFAPVADLGLVAIWDDGDDVHHEPRAPYPHARDVLVLRAHLAGAAALVGGFSPSVEAAALVESGWARPLRADRPMLRACAPRVVASGSDAGQAHDPLARVARLPNFAWEAARAALAQEAPVLVQVPRHGYQPGLACASCRAAARCPACAGPLGRAAADSVLACRWCARPQPSWRCPRCGHERLRAQAEGERRTADELGRAFPGHVVRVSGRDEVLDAVPAGPALVVATPGAEPVADGGYGAVLLLDAWVLLGRPDLRAAEETARRWFAAAALARPAPAGGAVVVVADAGVAPVQALIRWDPAGFARRELAERRELGFPPAVRMASVEGQPEAVADLLDGAALPAPTDVLGPVPLDYRDPDAGERMLLRVPREDGAALAAALKTAVALRSARRPARRPWAGGPGLRVRLDPAVIG